MRRKMRGEPATPHLTRRMALEGGSGRLNSSGTMPESAVGHLQDAVVDDENEIPPRAPAARAIPVR